MVQQMAIYVQPIVSVPLSCPSQSGNLSRQDAGWKVFRFLQRAADMNFQQLMRASSMTSTLRGQPNIGMATVKVV